VRELFTEDTMCDIPELPHFGQSRAEDHDGILDWYKLLDAEEKRDG
jgi:hypothetical protein